MGEKGFVLCVCQGTCPSFTKMYIFAVLSDIRRETSILLAEVIHNDDFSFKSDTQSAGLTGGRFPRTNSMVH